MPSATVRPLAPADLSEALDLWVAAWQAAYPAIDFSARRGWIAERIAGAHAAVAVLDGRIAGLLVIDPRSGDLDQLVVATACQGRGVAAALIAEARRLAPAGLDLTVNQDNARAIRFYEKHGFVRTGAAVNPNSGAPTFRMSWRPGRRL
ncbi:MAG: GNAT family N-acetyltransferase [Bradyrhizobiaceae bacterium]|nr:MAG: GNAT family N-acetyltransferase [Bradyrhizobiaceae bacterium]